MELIALVYVCLSLICAIHALILYLNMSKQDKSLRQLQMEELKPVIVFGVLTMFTALLANVFIK